MSAEISTNPVLVTNFAGTFSVESDGYIQGVFMDDPAVRFALAGGILATSETLPMWGGVAIAEAIPTPADQATELGGVITRATTNGTITGFSVFNQASNMILTPQSAVPLAATGMSVHFFRLGSGARIAVQMDPALVDLEGDPITQQVSWDLTNQKLIAYDGAIGALACKVLNVNVGNSKIVDYSSPYANWTPNGSCALILI